MNDESKLLIILSELRKTFAQLKLGSQQYYKGLSKIPPPDSIVDKPYFEDFLKSWIKERSSYTDKDIIEDRDLDILLQRGIDYLDVLRVLRQYIVVDTLMKEG